MESMSSRTNSVGRWHGHNGVTLIELMVVIVIIAILASIAYPSYSRYVMRSNRTEAKMALLSVQAAQEKFFLQNNRYATNGELSGTPPAGLGISATTSGGKYAISLAPGLPANQYQATAVAQGSQTGDTATCQTLSINQQGIRTPADSSGCWR